MLNKREKVLLNILFLILLICGLVIFIVIRSADLENTFKRIHDIETLLTNEETGLPDANILEQQYKLIEKEILQIKERLYSEEETDTYKFGNTIQTLLTKNKMQIVRTQPVRIEGNTYIEFSITGNVLNFINFLKTITESNKYWKIPYLVINNKNINNSLRIDFRISYETYN
jgi:hypothetical protein